MAEDSMGRRLHFQPLFANREWEGMTCAGVVVPDCGDGSTASGSGEEGRALAPGSLPDWCCLATLCWDLKSSGVEVRVPFKALYLHVVIWSRPREPGLCSLFVSFALLYF